MCGFRSDEDCTEAKRFVCFAPSLLVQCSGAYPSSFDEVKHRRLSSVLLSLASSTNISQENDLCYHSSPSNYYNFTDATAYCNDMVGVNAKLVGTQIKRYLLCKVIVIYVV